MLFEQPAEPGLITGVRLTQSPDVGPEGVRWIEPGGPPQSLGPQLGLAGDHHALPCDREGPGVLGLDPETIELFPDGSQVVGGNAERVVKLLANGPLATSSVARISSSLASSTVARRHHGKNSEYALTFATRANIWAAENGTSALRSTTVAAMSIRGSSRGLHLART